MLGRILRFTGLSYVIRYLRGNNASFARWYQYKLLNRMVRSGNPWLLVYTMGKVGTNTINSSIRQHLNSYETFHFHWLNPENLKKDEYFHRVFYETGKELRGGKEILLII